jgi:putative membrane protein
MAHGIQRSSRRALGVLAVALMGLGLGGCLHEDTEWTPAGYEKDPPEEALSESQIAGVVSVINRGEIMQAQSALQLLDKADVRDYAQHMLDEHQKSEQRLSVILPEIGLDRGESELSQRLESTGQMMNANLNNLATGQDPDPAYLEIQIAMHRQALQLLDEQLIPAAQRPEIRAFLQETRSSVQMHLIDALRLRRQFPDVEI